MTQVALFVDFEAIPERSQDFDALIRRHAAATLEEEDGCLAFTVGIDREAPNHFWLFELYTDDAALAYHRNSARLLKFREDVKPLVRGLQRVEADIQTP